MQSEQGEYRQALTTLTRARTIAERSGYQATRADVLHNVALVYGKQGDVQNALKSFQEALVPTRQLGSVSEQVATLKNIGMLLLEQLGDAAGARHHFGSAVQLQHQLGDSSADLGDTLGWYGEASFRLGDLSAAWQSFMEAAAVFAAVGDAHMAGYSRARAEAVGK